MRAESLKTDTVCLVQYEVYRSADQRVIARSNTVDMICRCCSAFGSLESRGKSALLRHPVTLKIIPSRRAALHCTVHSYSTKRQNVTLFPYSVDGRQTEVGGERGNYINLHQLPLVAGVIAKRQRWLQPGRSVCTVPRALDGPGPMVLSPWTADQACTMRSGRNHWCISMRVDF